MDRVKALRDETGISIMQCKKALEDAGGDRDKALMALRKKSGDIAAKKSDRALGAGVIAAYIHANGSVGAMLELSCETDFVSKNPEFKQLAYDIAMHAAAMNPRYVRMEDVSNAEREKVAGFFKEEVDAMKGKSEEIKQKALEGKLDAYFKEQTLLEQPYVKDPSVTVGQMITSAIQKFGENIHVTRFSRFAVGK